MAMNDSERGSSVPSPTYCSTSLRIAIASFGFAPRMRMTLLLLPGAGRDASQELLWRTYAMEQRDGARHRGIFVQPACELGLRSEHIARELRAQRATDERTGGVIHGAAHRDATRLHPAIQLVPHGGRDREVRIADRV